MLAGLAKSTKKVGRTSWSRSSMTSIPLSPCRPGTSERASGVRAGADMSNDEFRLPSVLPDLAGLGELTLARGILRVVTAPVGVSWCIRASIEAAASVEWKLGGRETCLDTGLFEKKRGDPGPSGGG